MVGRDEELGDIDDESLARVLLISTKKKQLEETADQVSQEIKGCFERLVDTLRGREKQLLRQVEAIHKQQLSLVQSNSEHLPGPTSLNADLSAEQELADQLLSFGRIDLSNSIAVNNSEPYKAEEYQEAAEDCVSFDKSLKSESEELDVSSVLRRKRDNNGNVNKIVSINFSCIPCDINVSDIETPVSASTPSTTKKVDNNSVTLEISSNSTGSISGKSPFNENKDNNFTFDAISLPNETASQGENFYFEDKSSNGINCPIIASDQTDDENASKAADGCTTLKVQEKAKDVLEHPIPIQQWLQQILAETETEPIIHEIGQFSKIPNTQLYCEFPVET